MHDDNKLTAAIVYGFFGGLAGAVALAILLIGTGILSIETKTIVQNENFWREWFSATSGWAAAIAATIVGFITLQPLLSQARHPKIEAAIKALDEQSKAINSFEKDYLELVSDYPYWEFHSDLKDFTNSRNWPDGVLIKKMEDHWSHWVETTSKLYDLIAEYRSAEIDFHQSNIKIPTLECDTSLLLDHLGNAQITCELGYDLKLVLSDSEEFINTAENQKILNEAIAVSNELKSLISEVKPWGPLRESLRKRKEAISAQRAKIKGMQITI